MAGLVKVGAGVAVGRGVATAHMAALQAHTQGYPASGGLEAFFADLGARLHVLWMFRNVRTLCCHGGTSFNGVLFAPAFCALYCLLPAGAPFLALRRLH